jgi:hypothetical protein
MRFVGMELRKGDTLRRRRHGRTCGETKADALDLPAPPQRRQDLFRGLDIIDGILQGPERRQGGPIRQCGHHAVAVGARVAGDLLAAVDIQQDASRRLRAIVETDDIALGHGVRLLR